MAPHRTEKQSTHASTDDRGFKASQKLCSPPEGEDIVITGMAGQFPDSNDVYHFRDNLFDKVDMVSGDYRRWKPMHPEVPQRTGKIPVISKFDTGFFGIGQRRANRTDPMIRLLLERTVEAVMDAGYHPDEIAGTKTGVFMGVSFTESERGNLFEKLVKNGNSVLGSARSMFAQQISYFFKLQGPTYITDTACSSSMYALEGAYKYMRKGICDNAIVGGASLVLDPILSLQFARLGVLSRDGVCKVFDNAADGYARSEGLSVIYLQKSKNARRIYARIIHTKTNCDGFKEKGITYPSTEMQKVLMKEVYQECNMDPSAVKYIEAHGTGTPVGDMEELNSLDDVLCRGRDEPLYVGSVKSNIGHNEPASGLCSIVKVLIGMECGFIPPNIHFNKPREGVAALEKERIKVVVDKIPWPDTNGIAGINSFGFGGANGHVLLTCNNKEKVNNSLPQDDLLRLVCVSGRTECAVTAILDDLKGRKLDTNFIKLLHKVFGKEIIGHLYRGYSILSKSGEEERSARYLGVNKRKLVWAFTNFDQNWPKVGRHLLVFPIFAETLAKIHDILLQETNINIVGIIKNFNRKEEIEQILGTMAIQICLADVLKTLGISPYFVTGSGTGELIAAYFDEFLTLNDVILAHLHVTLAFSKRNYDTIDKDLLLGNLKSVIPKQKRQTQKWLPQYQRNQTNHGQGSVEYFAEEIASPTTFEERRELLENSTVLVIGPRVEKVQSQSLLSLIGGDLSDPVQKLLTTLGSLYETGVDMYLDELYPVISWPVSRGTPMVSPLVKWEHNSDWYVDLYQNQSVITNGQRVAHVITKEFDWNFVTGHIIDGRNLFPATGYLMLAWETLASMLGKQVSEMKVVFENVKFIRATNLPTQGDVELRTVVQLGERNFEITEGGTTVATGKIYELDDTNLRIAELPLVENETDDLRLNEKDIYRELKIRGYNYKGLFRSLKECDVSITKGLLAWRRNWIAFMDNMLQMKILQVDTKNLYVPTSIQLAIIDGISHENYCTRIEENESVLPVYLYKEANIIRSGGVEIRGMNATAIPRRKYGIPILEAYKFVPNEASLLLAQSVRIMIQIILENNLTINVKSVEEPDLSKNDQQLLSPLIQQALSDMPLIQAELTVLSKTLEVPGIKVEDKKLSLETNCLLAVVSNLLQNDEILKDVLNIVQDTSGYIITRESTNSDLSALVSSGLDVLCVHKTEEETLILLKKSMKNNQTVIIDISDSLDNPNWLLVVQNAIKDSQKLILYAQNRFVNGILGLVNCLRRESNGSKIYCFFIIDDAPKFDVNHPFYKEQVRKHMSINVWRGGKWGTYRHLQLQESPRVPSEHCYVNVTVYGDLSSLRWTEGPLTKNSALEIDETLVHVYFSALNFKDVMIASGRLSNDILSSGRLEQECVQGMEFSGRDASGQRVMGMVKSGALSSLVIADSNFMWTIPDEWSLEDAATIPVVYATVIYALMVRAGVKHGQSILIHSATGGVGQAAINIALHFGCNVFATVGTQEKRDFLRKNYPQIKESHIGNSRDTSFEQMVQIQTRGHGVDIVLNSLAEEKLQASVRCLANGGNFLEIGRFDLASDNQLGLQLFRKQATFHGVMLDTVLVGESTTKKELTHYMSNLIKKGVIKPLLRTVFKRNELLQAYRYMSTGKHMGKVLIRVREEENEKFCHVAPEVFKGIPRYFCNPVNTYIIVGGLGGFGLQLADWLVIRGARKIVLGSRTGIKTGHQAMMIRLWREYGAQVVIRNDDVTSREGCEQMIKYANSLGPVKGIFNLAVVLKDAFFENQTIENYRTSWAPKAVATQHLDAVTRKECPELSDFVVFSSVSCGRGNAGQTNYGMANSIMERICETRKAAGYPALAIQWGAIGDVGLVAEMQDSDTELIIGGTLQQKISSCLQVLDRFLGQSEPIVSSMVVAEKQNVASGAKDIVDAVANIIGIESLKKISLHSTFPELGMDSMMAVEIKQTLEREYEVFFSAQDIRTMTFSRLQEIAKEKMVDSASTPVLPKLEELSEDVKLLLHHVGNSASSNEPIIRMNTLASKSANAVTVFVLPGIEGTSISMEPLVKSLNAHAMCLQYRTDMDIHSIEDWAKAVFPYVEANPTNFVLIAHSFGCAVATELVHLLESTTGCHGKVIFIDGSPGLVAEVFRKQFDVESEELFQTSVICAYMTRYLPFHTIMKHKADILKCPTLEDRIKLGLTLTPKLDQSPEYVTAQCVQGYRRIKASVNYVPNFIKLKSEIKLFKPRIPIIFDYSEDYKLSELFEKRVDVMSFDGNHLTILENPDVVMAINRFINNEKTSCENGTAARMFQKGGEH